jgi:hypothetical protein
MAKDKKEIVAMEVVETVPEKSSDTMMGLIEKIALMPDSVATGNLERLHEMHKEMQNREAEVSFNKAFVAAQLEMPIVIKDAWNDHTKSRFARLEIITKQIKPIYTAHGFGMIGGSDTCPIPDHKRITIDLVHSGGHSKHFFYDVPLDDKGAKGTVNKTAVHAHGASTTYARRYLGCLIWDVQISEDDDGNNTQPQELITKSNAADIRALLTEKGRTEEQFCKLYHVDKIENIWLSNYEDAIKTITRVL